MGLQLYAPINRVHAGRIHSITRGSPNSRVFVYGETPKDGAIELIAIDVLDTIIALNGAEVGWYFVQHQDGYVQFLPANRFEKVYSVMYTMAVNQDRSGDDGTGV